MSAQGKDWIRDKALLAIPELVRCAQLRETITYGDLARRIGLHHRQMRHIAGYVRDKICRPRKLPLLNALIVNAQTRMPGESYLPGEGKSGHDLKDRNNFEKFRDDVFAYAEWDRLLTELRLPSVSRPSKDLNAEARAYIEVSSRAGGGVESEAHRSLKERVSKEPQLLGLAAGVKAHVELRFLSGDEADVAFDCGDHGWAVVEVKVGIRGELVKGIYQAIKYRALAEAQIGCKAAAYLVAYNIPEDIASFAKTHGISPVVIHAS